MSAEAPRSKQFRSELVLAALLCAGVTAVAYHARLDTYFFQDDLAMIAHGVDCWKTGDVFRLFTTDQYEIPEINRLRPVVLSVFALVYRVAGLDALWFRAINLSAHVATGLLIFWLVRRRGSLAAGLLSASLFLTWPSLSNAVFPVCTLTDLLAGFLGTLAVCFFVSGLEQANRSRRIAFMLMVCLCYVLAQFSKESAIGTGPILIVAGWLLAKRPLRTSIAHSLPVFALTAGYLAWRRFAFGVLLTGGRISFGGTAKEWLNKYVGLFYELVLGLSFDGMKLAATPKGVPVLVVVCLLAVALLLWGTWRARHFLAALPLVVYGFTSFAVSLLFVMYYPSCRNLYVPLIGLSIALGSGVAAAVHRLHSRRGARAALLAVVAVAFVSRMAILHVQSEQNGRAGDLFHAVVTQLDAISRQNGDEQATVHAFAVPFEAAEPMLLDTPWIICGGEAGVYQRLMYGRQFSQFSYDFGTMLRTQTHSGAIQLRRTGPDVVELRLGDGAEFHFATDLAAQSPLWTVKTLQTRLVYRDAVPSAIQVAFKPAGLTNRHVYTYFDGARIVALNLGASATGL